MKYAKIFLPILIILALVWFFFEKGNVKHEPGTFASIGEYFLVDSSQVDKVELTDGIQSVSIAKNGDEWDMTAPIASPADLTTMDKLIATVLQNAVHRVLSAEDAGDLSEYGLDASQKSVTFYGGGKPLLDLKFGDESLTGSDFYAKKGGGGEVLLIAVQIRDVLKFEPNDFRSQNPFQLDESGITQITLTYPDSYWRLDKRNDTGNWYITEPEIFRANNSKIGRLIGQLNSMKIVRFMGTKLEGEQTGGLDNPVVKLEIKSGIDQEGKTISMLLGDTDVPANAVIARISNIPDEDVLVEASILHKLQLKPEDIREDSLFIVDPSQVTSLDVRERGAKNLSIFQDDKGVWKMLSPTPGNIANSALENYFKQIHNLRPSEYISPEELEKLDSNITGFESYAVKIVVKRKDGYNPLEITIGQKDKEKGYYLKTSDIEGAYFVSAQLVEEFLNANKRLKGE